MRSRSFLFRITTFLLLWATSNAFAASAGAHLSQCGNLVRGSATDCTWQNGNLNSNQAHWLEGDSVPYQLVLTGLTPGKSYTVVIGYDSTKGGKHAIDYLTSYDHTMAGGSPAISPTNGTANECLGITGCSSPPSTFAIPHDSNVSKAGVTQATGNFAAFNGTITSVGGYSRSGDYSTNSQTSIAVTFAAGPANADGSTTVVLAWGGHIATRMDWGRNAAAVNISGSPYHMSLVSFSGGASGSQDRSFNASAVIFPTIITISKTAIPLSSTSFPFTITPALPVGTGSFSSFSLANNGVESNSVSYTLNTPSAFNVAYAFQEAAVAGWNLAGLNCTVDPVSGSTATTSGTTATITPGQAGFITCAYTNTEPTVATPTFSPAPGLYTSIQNVAISTTTPDASIRYTTDGSTPTQTTGLVYTGPVTIASTATIKAIAYGPGMIDSALASGLYTINIPALTTVSPSSGQQGQALTAVQITGQFTHFAAGSSSVTFSNPGITADTISVIDATHLTATVTVAAGASVGTSNVTVTTGGETATGNNLFIVAAGTPALTTVSPSSGQQGQTLTAVQITGQFTHFAAGSSSVTFSNPGITASSISVTDATHLTATVTVAAGASVGASNATVTTGGETATGNNLFTVTAGTPALTTVSPSSGQQGQTLTAVQITGQFTHFAAGSSSVTFSNPGITASSISVTDATHLTATVTIAAGASIGASNVTVTTGSEIATGSNLFTVNIGTPVATPTFSLAAGTYSSTQTVTITTTTPGASIRYTLDGSTPTETVGTLYTAPVTVSSTTTIKAIAYESGYLHSDVSSATYTLPLSVTVAPATVTVYAGQTQTFTATVANTSNQTVTWSSAPAGVGSIDTVTGVYTAPPTTATQQTVTITARSQVDGVTTGSATVTLLPPIIVTVSPATATLSASQTQQFTATLTNTSDTSATWAINPPGAGTISSTGFYTAPASITASQSITVTARSVVDSTKAATATITLSACAVSSTYSHVRGIVIDHTKVPGTDLANFPVLISGTYSYLATTANGGGVQSPDGFDIAFASDFAGTIKLDHEMESYDPATGAIVAWVRIPLLSHTADTAIYIHYGKSGITSSQENKAGVWDSNYVGVYHLPNGVVLSAGDSTANATNGTLQGSPSAIAGKIGGAANFGASASLISINSISLNGVSYSISTWFNWPLPVTGSWNTLTRGATADHQVKVRGSDWHLGAYDNAGGTAFRDSGFAMNTLSNGWHYLAAVGSNGNTDYYIDGVKVGTIPFKSNAQITYLGNYQGGGQQWGKTDELRISKNARSADWIATEFNNQNLPATFYTIYGENQTGLIVSPAAASLYRGQSQQFTTIPVADCNTAVTWRISPSDAGSIDSTGMYSAPATISVPQTVTAFATSQVDNTTSGSAAITLLPPISVTVAPQTGSLSAGQMLQFTATLQNATSSAVTWSISPAGLGSISSTGLYSAPLLVSSGQTVTVIATSVVDPAKSGSAILPLLVGSFTPIRVNAGGPAYTDPQGLFWSASNGFTQGAGVPGSFSFTPPAGSNVPFIYQTGLRAMNGSFQYQTSVPNGQYLVTLKFADSSYSNDTFDVAINGVTVLSRKNVWATVGQYNPLDATFPVTVTNNQITIVFTSIIYYAIVNALQIVAANSVDVLPHNPSLLTQQSMQFTASVQGATSQAVTWAITPNIGTISASGLYQAPASLAGPATVTVTATSTENPNLVGSSVISLLPNTAGAFVPIRVNAGGPAYTDPQGLFWSASNGFTQGAGVPGSFSFTPPAGSNVPFIYQTGLRAFNGSFQYQASVPNGQYLVTLKFADSGYSNDTFDVSINGANVLWRMNVWAAVGPYTAWDATFPVNVNNGQITIVFSSITYYAIINAIQIVAAGEVEIWPTSAAIWQSKTLQFGATVANTTDPSVAWSVTPPGAGSISATGLYTAPASITSQQAVTVTATGVAAPNHSASAIVTLWPPVSVTVAPLTATLSGGQMQQFNANLTNAGGTGVAWSITPAGRGSISTAGLYTAPAVFEAQTATVTATSLADGATASATITLTPAVTVTVTPATVTLGPSQFRQFTANVSGAWNAGVTWTVNPAIGTISPDGVYTAPSTITATTTVTVSASSKLVPTASGSATLTLSPAQSGVSVTVSPATATVLAWQAQQFTATVAGTGNTAVTWSLSPNVGTITSSGLYTAPAGVTAPQTVTVQAVSSAYPTVSGRASIIVNPAVTNNYTYRRPIVIDHTKVANADQINFPVLISGRYDYLAGTGNGGKVQSASGYDIMFSPDCAGLQKLDHKIASYQASDGTVTMWVILPLVSHTTDTVFYISYGDGAVTSSQENRPAVDAVLDSTTARSADWLATAANNQNSPSTFYTIYPENANSIAPSSATLISSQTQQFLPLFTVGPLASTANPLALVGTSPTPSPAQSVALNGNYAYVCDNNEVSVFDVSNPAAPRFLTPALAPFMQNDGIAHCAALNRSAGPVLVGFIDAVSSGQGNNPAFVAFNLQNASAPQLIAEMGISKRFWKQPVYSADGNTAFVPTSAYTTFVGSWDNQYGDVVAVDVTNLSAPAVLGTMEPAIDATLGGANPMFGAVLATPATLLVGGTSSSGAANNGAGQLIVADVSNPRAMSIITRVSVPNTRLLFGPVLHGNIAVALGNTGGATASGGGGYGPITATYLGKLVLTTFDISDPRNPVLLANVNLPYGPQPGPAVQIGNNLTLFGAQDASNQYYLLLIDTTNPRNPVVTPYPAPTAITNMYVAGSLLHVTAGAAGYAIYQIPGVTPTQYGLSGSCAAPVTWTLSTGAPGTINASGLYAAPSNITADQHLTVTAVSTADATMTASASVNLASAIALTFAAAAPSPYVRGSPAAFVATATSGTSPVAGVTVTFTITGANPATRTAVTDANGRATLTYSGTVRGVDTIQAASGSATSFALTALWVSPAATISTTAVTASFFATPTCTSGCEAFSVPANQVPTFVQTFPNLMFNPPGAVPAMRSFADQVLDAAGAPAGSIVAQGNGRMAGAGDMAGFSAVFRGSFVVTQAGAYTINVTSQDGFLFGAGNGATRVSGVNINPPASGATPFAQYPIMGANNGPSTGAAAPIVVSFPAPGSYAYEFDYRSGTGGPLTFTVTVTQGSNTAGLRPLEALVLTSNTSTFIAGQTASFSVKATDETGAPIVALPVTVSVTGLNPQTLSGLTNSSGIATVAYTEQTAITDTLQASALVNGLQLFSGQTIVPWGQPATSPNAPLITVSGEKQLRLPQTGTYTATVTDPAAPAGGPISVKWTQTGGPAAVQIASPQQTATSVTFPIPGVYTLQITATDAFGSSALTVGPITVLAADTRSLPQGWLDGIANPQLVTGQLSVNLIPGKTLTAGTLLLYPVNKTSGIVDLNPATAITLKSPATGSGTLATIDTTLLANGPYYILLQATDTAGQTMTSGMSIVVGGDYKPGRVTTAVTDLTVPAPGLPVQIGRSYDSLGRNTSSDFGNGWTLGVNVQLSVSATNDVTLTINGQRRTFYFTPYLMGYQLPDGTFVPNLLGVYASAYTPEPGLYGTLTVGTDGSALVGSNTGCLFDWIVGSPENVYFCYNNVGLYSPGSYVYTDPYGRVYSIGGDGSLKSITDAAGNKLTITAGGITGPNGLNVPFVRDAQGRITKITNPLGNEYLYGYDAAGNLASVTYPGVATPVRYNYDATHLYKGGSDPRGNALPVTEYYPDGRLQSVTDALGQKTSYVYDTATRTTTVTYPDGGRATEVYDSYGSVLSTTDALGHTTINTYDANHRVTSIQDPLGHTTKYTYDNGNRTSVTNALEKVSRTSYNQYSEPVQTVDELQNARTFSYDANYWPKLASDALGPVVSLTFSGRGTMLSKAVGYDLAVTAGKATSYTYDMYGNLASETDAVGRTTLYTYDTLGRKKSMTAANGAVTAYDYDALGRLKTETGPLGRVSSYEYDGNGNKLSETDANNRTTAYEYDALNRLKKVTYPNSTTKSYTYDFRNQLVDTTDEGGRVTHNEYDAAGRLTAVTVAYGTGEASRTGYTYYADGRKETETDAGGHTTTYYYDAAGRLTSVVDAQGQTTQYGYDDAGNQTSVTDAKNHLTQHQYDARRRLVKTTYHDGTTTQYSYDRPGNLASVTDQAGKIVQYGYDGANQLRSVVQVNHPDPAHNTTAYGYDAGGNLASTTDANGHTRQSTFDVLNQLKAETMASGNLTQTRTYDAAGNLVSLTDYNGNTTTYTYDAMNRLLTKTPDAKLGETGVSFTYTATGKRATMTDPSGTTTYTYDSQDRLVGKATPQGKLTYTYDAAGNVALMQSSNTNGVWVGYTYDSLNRLSTVVDHHLPASANTTTYTYDAANNLGTVTSPNGLSSTFVYDDLNRVKSVNGYQYQLGPTGNRTNATEPGGRTLGWSYDGIYRLTQETISLDPRSKNGTVTYGLDPVGNRLSQTSSIPGISTGSFTYDANDRLSTEQYDNNGNTVVSGVRTFAYDFENRLKSMNGGAVTITYDGDGNRVAKTIGSVTTRYLVDELNPTGYSQVVEELTGAAVTRRYTLGLQRISQDQLINSTWTPSFYGYDSFGSVRTLADTAGTVTDTYDYDAFGNVLSSTGTTPNSCLYRGEQYDQGLTLYYLRARYMNPTTGRFLSTDQAFGEIEDPASLHKYLYTAANPVDQMDPSGLSTITDPQKAGLLIFDPTNAGGYLAFSPVQLTFPQAKETVSRPMPKCDTPVQRCCRWVDLGGWKDKVMRACGLKHCWLKTSSKEAGLQPIDDGPLPANPVGIPVMIKDQSKEKGDCTPLPGVDEKCVNDELQIGKPLGRWYPWAQCNTFVEGIIARCSKDWCPLIGPGSPKPALMR